MPTTRYKPHQREGLIEIALSLRQMIFVKPAVIGIEREKRGKNYTLS